MLAAKVSMVNLDAVQKQIERAGEAGMEVAAQALNDGIEYARQIGADAIMDQVNFRPGYLDLPERFAITQHATPTRPEARLTARHRSTSLGSFAEGGAGKSQGVKVKVQRAGSTKHMKRAFYVGLNNSNLGVAVRVKPGESAPGYKPTKLFEDQYGVVYLLYGPSVNQVFTDVAQDINPQVSTFVLQRFATLFTARFGG